MRETIHRHVRAHWRSVTVVVLTVALFWYHDLFAFLATTAYAGRDLAGNFAFTWLMEQHLAQFRVVAWTDRFALGISAFASYPPLVFIVPAALNILTGGLVGLKPLFNVTVFASVFLLPAAAFHALRPSKPARVAFLAAAYTLLAVFVYQPVSIAYQTFSVGLVAQAFALLLLLPAVGALLRPGRGDRIAAGVLLGLAILAHPFVGLSGLVIAATLALRHRDPHRLLPPALGLLLAAPWLVPAAARTFALPSYTFAPAQPGWVLAVLLPLVVLGGMRDADFQALLGAFAILLVLSAVETPFVAQELRFYTYALLLGAVLAGVGAAEAVERLSPRIDRRLLLAAVVLPVVALSAHAAVPATWSFQGDAAPLYDALDDLPQGDVIVETRDDSIFDSYALQAAIPLRTHHDTANGVHVDQSRNATAILQAEHWISADPLYTPLCRNCSRAAPDARVVRRLRDLGIDYIVARTPTAARRLNDTFAAAGRHGDYWLFRTG